MKRFLVLAILAARLTAQVASVEGTVVDQTTGKPLPRVHVSLLTASDAFSADAASGAISDSAGHFSVSQMPPGHYQAILRLTGYVQAAENLNFDLKVGQQLTGLNFKMAQASMLTGRVVDEEGDPMSGVAIVVSPVTPGQIASLARDWREKETDERGEFRILTGPGKYYVKASPSTMRFQGTPEIRSDGTIEKLYATTYYPGAATKESATPVEVIAGRDAEGIVIHLRGPASQPPLTVSGTVTGLPADSQASVVATRVSDAEQQFGTAFAQTRRDGTFALAGLSPGIWDVFAQVPVRTKFLVARARFTLNSSDVTNLLLAPQEPGDLTGTVEVAGGRSKETWTIRLERFGGGPRLSGENTAARVDRDGSFRIAKVWPGSFRVAIDPLPDTAYLKTVELDGVALKDGAVEIMGGVPRLKVTVGLDGAVISGKVRNEKGDPPAGDLGVFLMAGPKDVKSSEPEVQNGKYGLTGVPPGRYRLVALNYGPAALDLDAVERDEALRKLFAAAEEFEIKPGDRLTKDLQLTPKEGADGKLP